MPQPQRSFNVKIIIKSKNESNHIHPYAKKKYGDTLDTADLFAVQRRYCAEIKVKQWHKRECNSKTASFETGAKQEDEEIIELLHKEIEKRVLADEAVKVTIIPKDQDGNALEPILLADVPQDNIERLAELYNLRQSGKKCDKSEMESLGVNLTPAAQLLAE